MEIEDRTKAFKNDPIGKYLVRSPEGTKLISLQYTGVPKSSPAFEQVLHTVNGSFGEMDVRFNRVTVASLIFWTQNLQRCLETVLPVQETSSVVTSQKEYMGSGVSSKHLSVFCFEINQIV